MKAKQANQLLYLHQTIIIIFFLISICWSCEPTYQKSKVIITDQLVEVHFGRELSTFDLDSIRHAVDKKGITLRYLNIKRDGKLLSFLQIEVNNNQGGIARAATKFANPRGRAFGFRIRLNGQNDQASFQVGEIAKAE